MGQIPSVMRTVEIAIDQKNTKSMGFSVEEEEEEDDLCSSTSSSSD